MADLVVTIILFGGVFDGIEGYAPNCAGLAEIWVYLKPSSRSVGVSQVHHVPGSVRYVLTSRCERGYIYSQGDGTGTLEIQSLDEELRLLNISSPMVVAA